MLQFLGYFSYQVENQIYGVLPFKRFSFLKALCACIILSAFNSGETFSPLSDNNAMKSLSNGILKFGNRIYQGRAPVPRIKAQVKAEPMGIKSPVTSVEIVHHKKHCDDGRCSMFRSNPEIRKIIIAYLQSKLSGEAHNSSGKLICNRERVRNIVAEISPPVAPILIEKEVDAITSKLFGNCIVEERDLITRALLDNSIWKEVGETVVKEFVYLDNLSSGDESGVGLLSESCASKLEVSY
jgi:hypothetical protein